MNTKSINLPLTTEDIMELKAGDSILLNGTIYVARDAAHKKIFDLIENNKDLPFDIKDSIIYYMGPSPTPPNKVIGSAGPTTSHRMDYYTPKLLDMGLKGMIGKGKRGKEVLKHILQNKAVYFSAIGGAGALYQDKILSNEVIAFPELGPEAVRRLEIRNFPVIVTIDSNGNNLYDTEKEKYKNKTDNKEITNYENGN